MSASERQRRVNIALWAYAYEVEFSPLVSDAVYDHAARQIDLSQATDRPDLDAWFREHFDPSTGMWVHRHPELDKLAALWRAATA